MVFILPLLFLIGLAVGSFLNCLIYRLNKGLSPIGGRSFCPKCNHQLSWKDNTPLLSFVLLGGRCRYCHSPISWQYPLVELGTGILSVVSLSAKGGLAFGWQFSVVRGANILSTGYWLLITYALFAIFVSDLRYGTIPDKIVYPVIGLAIIYSIFDIQYSIFENFLSALGAAGFFLALVTITRGKGMGMGDVKLVALMGLVLGWPKIAVALYLAFLTGAIVGVILILLGKKRFGEHIPFGPFLTTATWIGLLWGGQILAWFQAWVLR